MVSAVEQNVTPRRITEQAGDAFPLHALLQEMDSNDFSRNTNTALKSKQRDCWCQSSGWRTSTHSRLVRVGWHILFFQHDERASQILEPQARSINLTDCR